MTRDQWDALSHDEKNRVAANVLFVDTADNLPDWWPMVTGEAGDVYAGLPDLVGSWDAMREVVEKMLDDLWAFSLSWSPLDGRYHAWFGSADEDYDGEAPTAPEAVALAALTALGHMEDG